MFLSLFYLTAFFFILFFFSAYLCILLFHSFQISVNSLRQSSFHNFKFALQLFFVSSALSVDSSPLETVSALTVTDATEIHQMAGFMGRLYTRRTRISGA